MNSRALNKKIEIRGLQSISDGFGGYDVTDEHIGYSWAQIKSLTVGKTWNLSDMGLIQANDNVLITVRKRNDFAYSTQDMYFVYRGKKYTIASAPTNIDFDDRFITFIGSAANFKGNVRFGQELILNGGFNNGLADWNNPSSHWVVIVDRGFYGEIIGSYPLEQSPNTILGKKYQLKFELEIVKGVVHVGWKDGNDTTVNVPVTTSGLHTYDIDSMWVNSPVVFTGDQVEATEFYLDNVSLKEKL